MTDQDQDNRPQFLMADGSRQPLAAPDEVDPPLIVEPGNQGESLNVQDTAAIQLLYRELCSMVYIARKLSYVVGSMYQDQPPQSDTAFMAINSDSPSGMTEIVEMPYQAADILESIENHLRYIEFEYGSVLDTREPTIE